MQLANADQRDMDTDLNGDGSVNFIDLGTTTAFFFLPPGPSEVAEEAP